MYSRVSMSGRIVRTSVLSVVAALALVFSSVGLGAPVASASTQHTLTPDCPGSGFSSQSLTVAPGDTIVFNSANCTAMSTVASNFTSDPTGIWTSPELDASAGTATFPATLSVSANPSKNTFALRFKSGSSDFTSAWAADITIAPPPDTPSAISASVADQMTILKWTGRMYAGGQYYEIEQSIDNSAWAPVSSGTCSGQVATNLATSGCTVSDLTNGTPYYFRIRGGDLTGSGDWGYLASPVTPSAPPPAPTGVTIDSEGDAQVAISWTAPVMDSTYAALSGYKVEVSSDGGSSWSTSIADSGSTNTSASVTSDGNFNLSNGTSYVFRVSGVNAAGAGAASSPSSAAVPYTVPAPVSDMTIRGSLLVGTTDTLTLTWDAPGDGGRSITKYEVEVAPQPAMMQQPSYSAPTAGTCVGSNVQSTTCTVAGLTQGSSYLFRIRAHNLAGWGPFSNDMMQGIAVPGPAGAPTSFQATPGDGQVELSWGLPTTWGGYQFFQGFDYDVEQSADNGQTWVTAATVTLPPLGQQNPQHPSTSSTTITGLTNGASYDFRVSAVTSYGNGNWATVSSVPSTIPGDPGSVTATRGDTQVLLSWTAPVSDGGSPVTDYEYEVSSDNGITFGSPVAIGSPATTFTVTGLTNGTAYVFRLKAKNVNGVSSVGAVSNSATPVALPATPTGLTATHGNGQVVLAWTPGASVGASLDGHLVEVSTNGGNSWTTAIADTGSPLGSATVTGLTNGTSYLFRVSGISSAGIGLPLALGSAVTPSTLPAAATGLLAQVGDEQVVLSWTAGANGGSAVTGYQVEQNDGSGWTSVISDTQSSATTYTVTGLTNGTSYDFRVIPINVNGASQATAPTLANSVVPVAAPGVPTITSAVAGPGSAIVTVAAGSGGAPASYTVTANPGGRTCTVTGASGSCTVTGLTAGANYTFSATATNANTTSSASAASATVVPTTPVSGGGTGPGNGGGSGGGNSAGSPGGSGPGSSPVVPVSAPPSVSTSVPVGPQGAGATVGGSVVPVTVQPAPAPVSGALSNGANVQVGSATVQLNGPSMGGSTAPSNLTVIPGQNVSLAASGFVAGSTVALYAIPSGVMVGTMTVTRTGAVSGAAVLDPSVTVGITAIQMAGQTSGGIVNLSITVSTGPPAIPVRTNTGDLPEVPAGSSIVLVNGVPQVNTPTRTATTINVVEGGSALTIASGGASGNPNPIRSNGAMTIEDDGLVSLQGTGYRDYVDVFLFSEPVFVGRLLVNPDGTFRGSLPVPAGLSVGQHTIQSVGQGAGGESIAISASVLKLGGLNADGSQRSFKRAAAFSQTSEKLNAAAKKKLAPVIQLAKESGAKVTVIGTYLKERKTAQDVRMAKKRAIAVQRYLKSQGVTGPIVVQVRSTIRPFSPQTRNRYVVVDVPSNVSG